MTPYEITRLVCYTFAAPCALYLALYSFRVRDYWLALFYGSFAALMVWYVVEITLASTGINTREYRVVGTPMVIAIAAALIGISWRVHKCRNDENCE